MDVLVNYRPHKIIIIELWIVLEIALFSKLVGALLGKVDCNIVVREFEQQSYCYIYFWTTL